MGHQERKGPKGTRASPACQDPAPVMPTKPNLPSPWQSQRATQGKGCPSNLTGSWWMREDITMLPLGNSYAASQVFTTSLMTSLWLTNIWLLAWFTMGSIGSRLLMLTQGTMMLPLDQPSFLWSRRMRYGCRSFTQNKMGFFMILIGQTAYLLASWYTLIKIISMKYRMRN